MVNGLNLTDSERREVRRLLDAGKPLPDKYRFLLFDEKQQVELVWNGKTSEVTNTVLPFQTIEHVDEPRAEEDTSVQGSLFDIDDRGRQLHGWTNKLIWGDNKLILSSLKNGPLREEIEEQGGIKLIYIDPPFDVGADFSVDIEIGEETFEKEPSVFEELAYRDTWGKGADSFNAMIYERLLLMKDLLSPDGSIFVHCDQRVNSYIRLILQELFGAENFHNEITWLRSSSGKTISKNLSRDTDTIYWFSKTDTYTLHPVYKPLSEATIAMYSLNDNDGRGKYRLYPLQKTASPGPETTYDYKDKEGRVWKCPKKGWRMKEEKLRALENDNRLVKTGNTLQEKAYWDERDNEGKLANNLWDDIPNLQGSSGEMLGYATQKPEKLIGRILEQASNKGDLIADFFVGSGTTLAVAEKMGRKWIGSDLGKFSIHTARKRMINVQRKLKKDGKDYRAFEILNLGKYERQHYIGVNHDLRDEDKRKQLQEKERQFVELILHAYKAESAKGFRTFSGQKSSRLVSIGPIDLPVTRLYVEEVIKEALEKKVTKVDILAFEYEMGLFPHMQEEAKAKGIDLALKQIPREVFDKQAVEKGQVVFNDVAYIEVKPHVSKKSLSIELTDFGVHYNQDSIKAAEADLKNGGNKIVVDSGQIVKVTKDKNGITKREVLTQKWTDWIDYWSVDFNFESRKEIIKVKDGDSFKDKWTGDYIFENE